MASKRLGMLIAPTSDNDRGIMLGVVRYVQDHGGWEITTREAVPSLAWESLRRWQGDALIAMVYYPQQHRALLRKKLPAVNTCARLDTENLPTVFSDNSQIGTAAAEHLLGLGLTRFGFVGRRNLYHDRARGDGFERAIHERGFSCERMELERKTPQPPDVEDLRAIGERLRGLNPPAGIFAAHDNLGCQVIEVCRQMGAKVPYDFAVMGVNNYELLCETAQPPLTSICQQAERIGYEAARLLDRIARGTASGIEHLRLPPGKLVRRRSTDFLAIDDPDVVAALVFIRAHAFEPITVEDLLGEVAVSRRTLDKKFLAALGHPPAEEIRRARIQRAQHLLTETAESVLTVAMRSGFRSVAGFDRAFQQRTGMTPGQYRRQFGPPARRL